MSENLGTKLVAPIVPSNTLDEFPSHLAKYGQGGYQSVANITARNAITAARREEGMLVHVIDSDNNGTPSTYKLIGGIVDDNWVQQSVLNLKDFGCKGDYNPLNDSGTDDTSCLSKAIDSLISIGGKLVIPQGNYKITSQIVKTLSANKKYEIEGIGEVIFYIILDSELSLDGNNFNGAIRLSGTKSSTELTIRNIKIIGNSTDRGSTSGLKIVNINRYKEEYVTTDYFSAIGRYLVSINEFMLIDPTCSYNRNAGLIVQDIGSQNGKTSIVWGGNLSYNGRTSGVADGDYGFAIGGVGVNSYNIIFYGTSADYNLRKGFDSHSGLNVKYIGCNSTGTGYSSGTSTTVSAFGFYMGNEPQCTTKDVVWDNCTVDGTGANAVTGAYVPFMMGSYNSADTDVGSVVLKDCIIKNIVLDIPITPIQILNSGGADNVVKNIHVDNLVVENITGSEDSTFISINTPNATYTPIGLIKITKCLLNMDYASYPVNLQCQKLIFENNDVTINNGTVAAFINCNPDTYGKIVGNNFFKGSGASVTSYISALETDNCIIYSNKDVNGNLLDEIGVNYSPDTNTVHKSGDETITGEKTFTEQLNTDDITGVIRADGTYPQASNLITTGMMGDYSPEMMCNLAFDRMAYLTYIGGSVSVSPAISGGATENLFKASATGIYWTNPSGDITVTITLPALWQYMKQLILLMYPEYHATSFDIYSSTNGTDWTLRKVVTNNTLSTYSLMFNIDATHLKFVFHTYNSAILFRIFQIAWNNYTYSNINPFAMSKSGDIAYGNITTTGQFVSTIVSGTAPLVISSSTVVQNLNADLLDGQHGSYYAINSAVVHLTGNETVAGIKTFSSPIASTVVTGTAPLTIASTTVVPNLNADKADGYDFNQGVKTTDSPTFAGLNLPYLVKKVISKTLTDNVETKIASIQGNPTFNQIRGEYVICAGQYSSTKSVYSGSFAEAISIGNNTVHLPSASPYTIFPINQSIALYDVPNYGGTITITWTLKSSGTDTVELYITADSNGNYVPVVYLNLEILGSACTVTTY